MPLASLKISSDIKNLIFNFFWQSAKETQVRKHLTKSDTNIKFVGPPVCVSIHNPVLKKL